MIGAKDERHRVEQKDTAFAIGFWFCGQGSSLTVWDVKLAGINDGKSAKLAAPVTRSPDHPIRDDYLSSRSQ
jgi:hypothetical protein